MEFPEERWLLHPWKCPRSSLGSWEGLGWDLRPFPCTRNSQGRGKTLGIGSAELRDIRGEEMSREKFQGAIPGGNEAGDRDAAVLPARPSAGRARIRP